MTKKSLEQIVEYKKRVPSEDDPDWAQEKVAGRKLWTIAIRTGDFLLKKIAVTRWLRAGLDHEQMKDSVVDAEKEAKK